MIIFNILPEEPESYLSCDICDYKLKPKVSARLREFAADKSDIVRCQKCHAQRGGKIATYDHVKAEWSVGE